MVASRKQVVTLVRSTVNHLNPDSIKAQLERLIDRGIGTTFRRFGWIGQFGVEHSSDTNGHKYTARVTLSKRQHRERDNSQQVFEKQLAEVVIKLLSAGRQQGWTSGDEKTHAIMADAMPVSQPQNFDLKLPEECSVHFNHIFDRDPQVRIICQAIRAAKASLFQKRHHCILWGKPGCGKTEVLLAFERMLGSDSVLKLDATSTSKAGAENLILEMDQVPPIIIIEEIEKCNPLNLPWLLGIMDNRGEIIKTNARVGSIRKEARSLVLATANNMDEFKQMLAGALASRFQHKIYFPRPQRDILEKILTREVKEIGGKLSWIKPALDYLLDIEKVNDPRRAISLLDGGDKLLTGEYQADLVSIREAMQRDNASEME